MNRNSFRTKNTLELHSLVYITLMCLVLLFFFLILGNVGKIVNAVNLDSGKADQTIINTMLKGGAKELTSKRLTTGVPGHAEIVSRFTGGNQNGRIALWGKEKSIDTLSSQLMIMEQSYDRVNSLAGLEEYDLLVLDGANVFEEELQHISDYISGGGDVWITNLSAELAKDPAFQKLTGIESCGSRVTWPGIRVSGDLANGVVMEDPEYKVTAFDLTLSNKIKLYASALPKKYEDMENKDLPPLIWRYVEEEKSGSVYVCNGNFMDTEVMYYMLPTILTEQQGAYAYGIINAYCVFVEDFPYAKNEERESWQRLYSRDKLSIAQDLLSAQYLRYYTGNNARITYFSRDYETFMNDPDRNLKFYVDNIDSSMGLLARKEGEKLCLEDAHEKLLIEDWKPGFSFTKGEDYCLAVNYDFMIGKEKEEDFNILGSALGVGYYGFNNDVDLLLDYDGKNDIWDEYCKEQESLLGIGVQKCGWLDRVTAAQALERLYSHMNSETKIEYGTNSVDIKTDAEKYWLILKGKSKEIEIFGGTAESIGERCWLITVDTGHAEIYFK